MARPIELRNTLLPDAYLDVALAEPDRPYCRLLHLDSDGHGASELITFSRLVYEARVVASNLSQTKSARSPGTPLNCVGTVAVSGYQYFVNCIACLLLGWTPILISPRNDPESIVGLLEAASASCFIYDPIYERFALFAKEKIPALILMPLAAIPDKHASATLPPFNRSKSTQDQILADYNEPAYYLHTSGSTGRPKLIPRTHARTLDSARCSTGDLYKGKNLYAPMPLSHGMGAYSAFSWTLGSPITLILLSFKVPPTAESMLRDLQYLQSLPTSRPTYPSDSEQSTVVFTPPSLLVDTVRIDPVEQSATRELARSTHRVFYGGAALDEGIGANLVKHGVKLCTVFGMTEASILSVMDLPDRDEPQNLLNDWRYIRFIEGVYDIQFVPVDGYDPDVYRQIIICPGPQMAPAVFNHDNPRGFTVQDLWERHPTKQKLWKHAGRIDHVIVLSNGEKIDHRQIEEELLATPYFARVLVSGTGRFCICVLVEPAKEFSGLSAATFLDACWPAIEDVNLKLPNYSKLLRNMFIVQHPNKQFKLTDKGTIKPNETLALYKDEIDKAYAGLQQQDDGEGANDDVLETLSPEVVALFIRDVVRKNLSFDIQDDANVFDNGMDSLCALSVRMQINQHISKAHTLHRNVVYTYPTINLLASHILERRSERSDAKAPSTQDKLGNLIRKYTANLVPRAALMNNVNELPQKVVVLTGSTGNFGTHLLASLLADDAVAKIVCLNRTKSNLALEKQLRRFSEVGYDENQLLRHMGTGRVTFNEVTLAAQDLGLDKDAYSQLQQGVTHIIHNAWDLNFNFIVDNFEAVHIAGVRHLVDFALAAPHSPHLIFMSSVGAVSNYPGKVPETGFSDPSVASVQGYGQSKFVAERIIDEASRGTGLRSTVVRSGQIAGSSFSGLWPKNEFIPILIRSSRAMGVLPSLGKPLWWLPADVGAQIVVDLISATGDPTTQPPPYMHLQNPLPTSWNDVVKSISNTTAGIVREIPGDDWLSRLRMHGENDKEAGGQAEIPAVRLYEFYDRFVREGGEKVVLDVSKALSISKKLEYVITDEILDKFITSILA